MAENSYGSEQNDALGTAQLAAMWLYFTDILMDSLRIKY